MKRIVSIGVVATLCMLVVDTPARADASLDLDEYRGKVVVVDFWASWCVPCRRSFPWLNQMQSRYADDGLVIIGINVDSDQEAANAFLAEYPADFRIVSDPGGALATQFEVMAMPSSYVFDREGELITKHLGFKVRRQDEYEAALKSALADREEVDHAEDAD